MMTLWFRWHPEVALRYLPVVDTIRKLPDQTVLEVGSGSLGIAPYLKKPVTGLDISFEGPTVPWMKQVRGSAQRLPFQDQSFNVVVAMDVLEHMPSGDRATATSECIRVARTLVVLGVPAGEAAVKEDTLLAKEYEQIHGKPHPNFVDHLRYGIPKLSEIDMWIENAVLSHKRQARIIRQSNESIWLHRMLIRGWMTPSLLADIFFRKILLPWIPVLRMVNQPPAYRMLYFIYLSG